MQAYQRWLHETRKRQTGVKRFCSGGQEMTHDTVTFRSEWVLDNAITEKVEDKKTENERTRLNITFRVHSHCIR